MRYETIVLHETDEELVVSCHIDAYQFVSSHYNLRDEEQVVLLTLGESRRLIGSHIIEVGEITSGTINVKDVMYKAIMDKAISIVVCFIKEESSVLLSPQTEDKDRATKIFEAAKIMNIRIAFQLVIGKNGYTIIEPPPKKS